MRRSGRLVGVDTELLGDTVQQLPVAFHALDEPVELLLASGHLPVSLVSNLVHPAQGALDEVAQLTEPLGRAPRHGERVEVHDERLHRDARGLRDGVQRGPSCVGIEVLDPGFDSLQCCGCQADAVGERVAAEACV